MKGEITMTTQTTVSPTCIGCKKKAEEIKSVRFFANEYGMTPDEFIREHEGTYNRFKENKFYCETCYIKAGMPTVNH